MDYVELLDRVVGRLSQEDRQRFVGIVQLLAELFDRAQSPSAESTKLLSDLEKYLKRKTSSPSATEERDELEYLRYVRNSLTHRSSIPDEAVRVAMPMFWRLLRQAAVDWEWQQLSRLLAYALKEPEMLRPDGSGAWRAQLKRYEDRFNRLSAMERDDVFRDLLLSIFEAPEFQRFIKKNRTRRSGG